MKKILKKIIPIYIIDTYRNIKNDIKQSILLTKNKNLISVYKVNIDSKCTFEPTVKINGRNVTLSNTSVGKNTYFQESCTFFDCSIGRYCSIGPNVRAGLGIHPSKQIVSTHPSFFSKSEVSPIHFADKNYFKESSNIIICNDVWIGYGATIRDGVTIGDGAIIGACALVIENVEPYTIVGGVPAKLIRKRFSNEEIDFLLSFKWWDKNEVWLKENWKEFLDIAEFKNKHDSK